MASNTHDPPAQAPKLNPPARTFPTGVIIEILSRMPLKHVARLQLVSKEWRSLIQSHYFKDRHMTHSQITYHWYNVLSGQGQSAHDSFSFMAGRDGILLMRKNIQDISYLWNPTTQQALELPGLRKGCQGITLTFIRATGSYRLASFYRDPKTGSEGCEVFTPGRPSPWKPLDIPGGPRGKRDKVSVISSGQDAHLVLYDRAEPETEETKIEVVSLNLETEKISVNRFGKSGRPDRRWESYRDLDWDGKLGIAGLVGPTMELLVLEDPERGKWCAEKRIFRLPFLKEGDEVVPLFMREGEIWFWMKGGNIFTYKIGTGETKNVREAKNMSTVARMYPYKPSLVGFEGMVLDTMLKIFRFNLELC